MLWGKVVTNPLIAASADRLGARRGVMITVACLTLAAYAGLFGAQGFWGVLPFAVLGGVAFAAILPLGEAIGLAVVYARGLDYGRLRLWGSVTFILASVGLGHLLASRGVDLILATMVALLGLVVLACIAMPAHRASGRAPAAPVRSRPCWRSRCSGCSSPSPA